MANIYIRPSTDVTFDGDGTTWAAAASGGGVGAKKGKPSTFTRGNVYYYADGAYVSHTLNTASSGTTTITLKKATIADHGTSTGWNDTMGDGQAIIATAINCVTTYWVIDGQVGSTDGSLIPYGFLVQGVEGGTTVTLNNNCTIRKVEAYGITSLDDYFYNSSTTIFGAAGTDSVIIDSCYGHGADNLINSQVGGADAGFNTTNLTVKNCWLQASRSTNSNIHSNVFYCTGVDGLLWFNNFAYNYNDEGLFLTWWEAPPKNITIYNSIFWGEGGPSATTNPRGIEMRQGKGGISGGYINITINGCTFVNLGSGGIANRAGEASDGGPVATTGCAAYNNLASGATISLGDFASVGTNTAGASSSIFVDATNGDFRLVNNTTNGTTLSSPYNTDLNGNPRPSGGIWDRGAYQFIVIALSKSIKRIGRKLKLRGYTS